MTIQYPFFEEAMETQHLNMPKKYLIGMLIFFAFLRHSTLTAQSTLSGTLAGDRTLTAAGSPWRVTADVMVSADVTLTVEPGAVVHFDPSAGIKVQAGGRLVAAGTDEARITLTRSPGSSSPWDGIEFDQTMTDNVLSHVDMTYGDRQNEMILVRYSMLLIDHAKWNNTTKIILELEHPSLLVRDSEFPDVDGQEVIHGAVLRDDEYLVLRGNTFGRPSGYNDVIDFSDCRRPGPVFEVYNNLFTGGGDDALDLDGCDAHIEGNVFMNFHQANGSSSTSNALATGVFNGYSPTIVVARNVFVNNDHAVLLKEDSFMRADNNVFANCVYGAINYGEWPDRTVDPGKGAVLDGNIFRNNGSAFQNQFAQPGKQDPVIELNRCAVSMDLHGLGTGNLDADPKFVNPENDFHLLPDSPLLGMGPNGLDMGAYVPAGASVSGEPDSVTDRTDATLTVGGPGITRYKYSVNNVDGPWTGEFSLQDNPAIGLANLADGQTVTVYVKGKNSGNRWQTEPDVAASKTWMVRVSPSGFTRSDPSDRSLDFRLCQNKPNPFNPATKIDYAVTGNSRVRLTVFDLKGREIATLVDGLKPAGRHSVTFDARNLKSGVYFYKLQTDDATITRKMLLVK
jgi:hypothetical protein